MSFTLKVEHNEQKCRFTLEWGEGQRLTNALVYPQYLTGTLTGLYSEWQRSYLSFYKSLAADRPSLRGRVEDSGSVAPSAVDWRSRLVKAEMQLVGEFHHWLRAAELFEIRKTIASSAAAGDSTTVDVFLTCYSLELERLPWETWDIAEEFNTACPIRIARTPASIRRGTGIKRSGKPRILVILGDDTGLNFEADKAAIAPLTQTHLAEVEFVGWQPGKEIKALTQEICTAIENERGWDILLFAGHSNESIAGGELAIAPQTWISLKEITPQLLKAKERGLQFALFNSCSGLSLANALVDLGLSQVAIVREPIHNQVAHIFLHHFLTELATFKDVHDCLRSTCQHLEREEHFNYPSAYLIPSLFRHPAAELYRIPPKRTRQDWLKLLALKPAEAIALSVLTLLSLYVPLQDKLIDRRVLAQAQYRAATGQIQQNATPPVLLVSIDEASIRKAGLIRPNPMDREYLAQLIRQLTAKDARAIGIDYLLDRPHGNSDRAIASVVQAAAQKQPHPTTFVFASMRDPIAGWLDILPEIARPNWSLQGQIHFAEWNVPLVPQNASADEKLPFAYLLSLAHRLNSGANVQPQLNSQTDFFAQIAQHLKSQGQDYRAIFSWRSQRQPLTAFSYKLRQLWLQPIVDFSIPPAQVYQQIPAWQLLEEGANAPQLSHLAQQVAIVAPGGYSEAGVAQPDTFPMPPAVEYWLKRSHSGHAPERLTGGEVHAYFIHHYLNQRLVIPIPDLWGIAIAILLGKAFLVLVETLKYLRKNRPLIAILVIGILAIYGSISLQIYLWAAVLLPWLLPSLAFALSASPSLRKT